MTDSGRGGNRGGKNRRPFRGRGNGPFNGDNGRGDAERGRENPGRYKEPAHFDKQGRKDQGRGGRERDDRDRYNGGQRGNKNTRPDRVREANRPKWTPPPISQEPLPSPDCPICGKPIKDIAQAVQDKIRNAPVHFDCLIKQISEGETLEKGDAITYIGGGRFGIVNFPNPHDTRGFKMKKILELEDKENRAEWRKTIADHFSVT